MNEIVRDVQEEKQNDEELLESNNSTEPLPNTKSEKKSRAARPVPERFPFPKHPLEEAIKVSTTIKEFNGGKAYSPKDVAAALNTSYGNNEFYRLLASSRDYGLTKGTTNNKEITLAELGRKIVYAKSQEDEKDAFLQAFLYVKLFKSVNEHYEGRQLPELKFLKNTLETEFTLPHEFHQEFYDVYTKNIQFLGIQDTKSDEKKDGSKAKTVSATKPVLKTSISAFVAMPFSEKTETYQPGFFQEVLKNLIEPASIAAGFSAGTAHRQGSDVIHSTIVNSLLDADLVIVDLTEHNPNVLFELGLRMAMEKPIILIKAKGTPQIFDIDNTLRVLDYDPRLWKSTIESDVVKLTDHIKGGWDNRDSSPSYMSLLRRHKED